MGKKLKRIFLFDTASSVDMQKIKPHITEDNRKFAIIWSSAEVIYWGFCLFMSFRDELFTRCRHAYLIAIIIGFLAWLCSLFLVKKMPKLIHLAMILVYVSLFAGSLLIAQSLLKTDTKTIMIFASVLLAPTLFVNNTLTSIILAVVDIIAAMLLLKPALTTEVYNWAITDLVIFCTIGVTLGHFVNKARFERYVFAESAMQFADANAKLAENQSKYAYYDQMTGLRNRRKFSEKSDQFKLYMPPYCCVVMVDINGLKIMNDTYGHEAGDELIISTAQCLKESFVQDHAIYRIGGDEFCIILTDPKVDVKACLDNLETSCRQRKGHYVNGISVSCGFASTEEFSDFRTVMKTADHRMYDNKRQYYSAMNEN